MIVCKSISPDNYGLLGLLSEVHLLNSTLSLEALSLLPEACFHLAPHVYETPLYDLELSLPLGVQLLSLRPVLLLQRLILFCLFSHE